MPLLGALRADGIAPTLLATSCLCGFGVLVFLVIRLAVRQQRQRRERLKAGLDAIRARDPAFDAVRLTEQVKRMAATLFESRRSHDATKSEPFLCDGIREELHYNIAVDRDAGVRVEMQKLSVDDCAIEEVARDGPLDLLLVTVSGRAQRLDVEIATGRTLQSGLLEGWWQAWTLMRRTDATSKADFALADGRCPACGAATAVGLAASCPACGRPFRSGKHDWVLVEIRPFAPNRPATLVADPPGARAMRGSDPAFSAHRVLDKGVSFFFRYLESQRSGDAALLRAMTPPAWWQQIAAVAKKSKTIPRDVAVFDVSVMAVVPNMGDGSSAAWVSIQWRGSETDLRGRRRMNFATLKLRRTLAVLTREEATLVALACGRCGAPYDVRDGDTCRACGRQLNDPDGDWIVEPPEEIRSVLDALASVGRMSVPFDLARRFDQEYAPKQL